MRLKEYNYSLGKMEGLFREYSFRFHISKSEMEIFYVLYNHDFSCLQSALWKETCLSRSTVNSSVKKLSKEGIVEISEKDGRDTHITLTELGRDYFQKTMMKLIRIEEKFFEQLDGDDFQKIMDLNKQYYEALKEGLEEIK